MDGRVHFINLLVALSCLLYGCESGQLCYNCTQLHHPTDCGKITECSDDESCFVEQFVTVSGNILYTSGCSPKSRCTLRQRSTGTTVTSVCYRCCDNHDFCNRAICDRSAQHVFSNRTTCLSCPDVSSPDRCEFSALCLETEMCYTEKILINHVMRYRLGCISKTACAPASTTGTTLIGRKRFILDDQYCASCCSDPYGNCNRGICDPTGKAPPSTTTELVLVTPPVRTDYCEDVTPLSCKLLGLQDNNFCHDPRVKNYACRSFCGTCDSSNMTTPTTTPSTIATIPVWTAWGSEVCSSLDGSCLTTRYRNCSTHTNTDCSGTFYEFGSCTPTKCPVWTAWGSEVCSSLDGSCLTIRYRNCSTHTNTDCSGKFYEFGSCTPTKCPGYSTPAPTVTTTTPRPTPTECVDKPGFCTADSVDVICADPVAAVQLCPVACKLCVSTQSTTLGPITLAPATTCVDKAVQCGYDPSDPVRIAFCSDPSLAASMCAKSCGICKATTCMDKAVQCGDNPSDPVRIAFCSDPSLAASMCAKSCGICKVECRDSSSLNCSSQQVKKFFCADEALAVNFCRKTCDKCNAPWRNVTYNTCGDPVATETTCAFLHSQICLCKDVELNGALCPNYCNNRCGTVGDCTLPHGRRSVELLDAAYAAADYIRKRK